MEWPQLSNTDIQALLIGAAIWAVSSLGFGQVWKVFKARGKTIKLAKRGLYWVIQYLADHGITEEDTSSLTIAHVREMIAQEEFKFPEKTK